MNQNPTPRWSPMVSGPEDDFANFLDFGELNFSAFDGSPQGNGGMQQDGGGSMDTAMEGAAGMVGLEQGHIQQIPHHMNGFQEPFPDVNIQTDMFNQPQQQSLPYLQRQQYHPQNAVPPTPNSLEMHGRHPQYYQTPTDLQQQQMFEQYKRHQRDQMNFTPLVSPAVTPLDTQFQYPDYSAPTDGFSPLTSPALRAQNHAIQHSVYGAMRSSENSDTTSPIDINHDSSAPTSASTPASLRKSKRKTSSSSTKNPARAVRQSPAMKPQSRRKQPSSTVIPAKEIAGIIEDARKSNPPGTNGTLNLPQSQESSGADSVSPEPLSEILMPPPATPKSNSAGISPYLTAKQCAATPSPGLGAGEGPATPASLMKIRKQAGKAGTTQRQSSNLKEQAMLAEADMEQIMEDIVLPEPASATKKPVPRPINAERANEDQPTPTASARIITTHGIASAPATATSSTFPSPNLGAMASPTGTTMNKRTDSKMKSRDPKKRNSNNSVQVSPALRPKISPSIKPLLPEGAIVSPETSALLLASKSNYQNILEGTHLPGVSYPETLSTNLTSKRTSHKIAEQGRRNRINTALQEIASLLPPPNTPPTNAMGGAGSGAGEGTAQKLMMSGSAAQQSNSKASTVELAIEYIKSLQNELRDVKGRLEEVEREKDAPPVPTPEAETGAGTGAE